MNKKVVLSVLSTAVVASMATAAFAKPSTGLYIGGSVDKYYSITQFLNNEDQVIDEINNTGFGDVLYVDDQGKAATIGEVVSADDLDDVLETATLADFKGNTYAKADGTTYDPSTDSDLTSVPAGDLKVESVSAINAGTLEIKFNKELDSTEAVDLTNYSIDGVTLDTTGTFGTVTPELSEDKKSVTFKLALATYTLTKNQTYRVQVADTLVDKAGNPVTAYDQLFTFVDNGAPTVVSSSYSDASKKFKISFSEPLTLSGLVGKVKVYDETNADVTAGTNRVVVAADQKSITVDASVATAYTAGKTYRVVILGATDLAGNYFAGNKVEASFKVDKVDDVKPTVTNFEVRNTKVVRVTFSEPVFVDAGASNKIADLKVDTQGTATPVVVGTLGTKGNAAMVNNDPKVWDITVDSSGLTGVHTIKLNAVKDLQGNVIAEEYVKLSTFSTDVTAPAIVAQNTAGTKLFLTFNEDTVLTAGTPTVLNPDKVETTLGSTTPTNDNGDAKVVVIDFGAAITKAGSYTVTIPSGMIKDAANQTKAYTVTANFTPADTVKPTLKLTGSSIATDAVAQTTNNTFIVKFSEPVNATAVNANNYTVNGEKVFENAVFDGSDATGKTVKLTARDNAITASGTLLFGVSGVQDLAGNTITAVETEEAIKENVAPTYTAKLVSSTEIQLTFSEPVVSSTASTGAIDKTDFIVYVNGTEATLATGTPVAASTGTTSVVLTLGTAIADLNQTIEVETSAASDVVDATKTGTIVLATDAIGNALAEGKVTVTK